MQLRNVAESDRVNASHQVELLKREMTTNRESAEKEKNDLETRNRNALVEMEFLHEQLEELSNSKNEGSRAAEKSITELQMTITSYRNSIQEIEIESQSKEQALHDAQARITDREEQVAKLEAEILMLKAQSGDAETIDVIKKELSEQVHHIRSIEAVNRDQLAELRQLRAAKRAIQVIEEEKQSLERKLASAKLLEAELAEARLQQNRLQDERIAWASYLENSSASDNSEKFDSPEAMARALAQERLTTASYMEQIGSLRADIAALEETIKNLKVERSQLRNQAEEMMTSASASSTDKMRVRLDRQRALALKEVEYLRAQLKFIDEEGQAKEPEVHDNLRVARIHELESLVDKYKAEVQNLHLELSTQNSKMEESLDPATGTKRSRDDDDCQEQLGQLTRKNRRLQEELTSMQNNAIILEKDALACREQLSAAKQHNQTRILSLRSNPTANNEAVKRSTLEALKRENMDLLVALRSKNRDPSVPAIPTSVLAAMEREIAAAKSETASAQKSARRLKEVWASKSQEFKEAIFSTLGWTVTFIPNGKMRVESTFFPSETDEHENSIVFDGERGTMKVGGGPKSPFARKISDHIGFWVREKGCIPGFLAALTLEFYEEHTRVPG